MLTAGFPLPSVPIFKVLVHLHPNYCQWLTDRIHQGQGCHVVTLNAEIAMMTEKKAAIARVIRQADLIVPDGAGIVLYLRLKGKKQRRVPGIELAEQLLAQAAVHNWHVVFFGGAPGIADQAKENWLQRFPQLKITTQHGYLTPETAVTWQATLAQLQPQLILTCLGVPKQEFWIEENRHLCPHSTWIGLGGSFDVWAGVKQRAPKLWQRLHLEWFYRLCQEPWRWRRMLALPQFVWHALWS
ncbi:UDP-N-acetyl-D-mannosaminuronic acid transferase [[Synechococcus] sp. NIES-970]|uniref:WecB/TagA/CpsF family glycosyltransferase n=1 Tax=Picosynechococcus sp. NKBG15041c TaxID=1407650 RepID=UPI00040EA971|nr:WecB/TagA/CpsF family glycosyltransferase [Picosynechococcus sp. NKBG15041c]BAW95967.1 UDP-N-acetyl-D-mannosaminuronic acid transferase [[Synechococcus] sp. NIES-970]